MKVMRAICLVGCGDFMQVKRTYRGTLVALLPCLQIRCEKRQLPERACDEVVSEVVSEVEIVFRKQLLMFFIQGMRLNSIESEQMPLGMLIKKTRESQDECKRTKQQNERWLLCNFKRIIVVIWPPRAYLPLISGCSIV